MTTNSIAPPILLANGLQPLSCVRCARHKVKCERLNPCSKCVKNHVACEFPPPKTGKRKRRKIPSTSCSSPSTNESLVARLDRYEEVLRSLGVDLDAVDVSNSTLKSITGSPRVEMELHNGSDVQQANGQENTSGCLVLDGMRSHNIDSDAWAATEIREHFNTGTLTPRSLNERPEDPTSEVFECPTKASDLVLRNNVGKAKDEDIRPSPAVFSQLWQSYLQNVHPLTMIVHGSSTGQLLAQAVRDRSQTVQETEALLFAVMACAVMSLNDTDCMRRFGERRASLLSKYRSACETALANARFLMSCNFTLLQAYTIYLIVIRPSIGPHELWNLTGIAKRNAMRLGLHHTKLIEGLSPFELEMRRRLWSQIYMHDAVAARLAGVQGLEPGCDIHVPSNVNDSDLLPNMEVSPEERAGATDMMFCILRYRISQLTAKVGGENTLSQSSGGNETHMVYRDPNAGIKCAIDQAEKAIELDLLRFCDILNPVHMLTSTVARLAICKLRFMTCASRVEEHTDDLTSDNQGSSFAIALRILEYENILQSQPATKGFQWYTDLDFQPSFLTHILQTLVTTQSRGARAEKAWEQIHILYESRPCLYKGMNQRSLYKSINKLTLDAWRLRTANVLTSDLAQETPAYLTVLREQEQQEALGLQTPISHIDPSLRSRSPSASQAGEGLRQLDSLAHDVTTWIGWSDFETTPDNGSADMMFFDNGIAHIDHDISRDPLQPLGWLGQSDNRWQ
ncbi:hypothetical protein F5Y18DRAFT_420135 [Xylariaceae sp. FL1019]|nr:hypothetical protein F5Y18DRAFT_420135 [Xylariaceae sp. FL1019]